MMRHQKEEDEKEADRSEYEITGELNYVEDFPPELFRRR